MRAILPQHKERHTLRQALHPEPLQGEANLLEKIPPELVRFGVLFTAGIVWTLIIAAAHLWARKHPNGRDPRRW